MLILNLNISTKGVFFIDKEGNRLTTNNSIKKIAVRFVSVLEEFQLFLLNIIGHVPSHTIRRFCYQLSGIKMGKKSIVHTGARFFKPKNITIGEGTIVGYNVFIDGRDSVRIGNHTDIASEVMIYNSEHDLSSPDFTATEDSVEIGSYCFIGPRVIIMPGVKIADGAVVAGGAVVTKNVEEKAIVGGVPAKQIGTRKISVLKYKLGRPKLFQ